MGNKPIVCVSGCMLAIDFDMYIPGWVKNLLAYSLEVCCNIFFRAGSTAEILLVLLLLI